MCLVFPTVLATLIKDVISPYKPWLAYILSSRLQQCYYCSKIICRQKSASDSLVMGCISNWKANLPREIFFHSPFRQPYSQRKHSQSAVHWVSEATVMWWICFLLLHLSQERKEELRGREGLRKLSLLATAYPGTWACELSGHGWIGFCSGPAIPWEGSPSVAAAGHPADCPSPQPQVAVAPRQP